MGGSIENLRAFAMSNYQAPLIDNLFTSHILLRELKSKRIADNDTVRPNRKRRTKPENVTLKETNSFPQMKRYATQTWSKQHCFLNQRSLSILIHITTLKRHHFNLLVLIVRYHGLWPTWKTVSKFPFWY